MITHTLSPDLEYYIGKLQPQYESDGHARIGQMLDQYEVPFFYKQATLICENGRRKIWRPDFTLPTYNSTVIEYHPNDDPTSNASIKSDIYKLNGITAIFLDKTNLTNPDWQQRLYEQLEKIYRHPLVYLSDQFLQSRH